MQGKMKRWIGRQAQKLAVWCGEEDRHLLLDQARRELVQQDNKRNEAEETREAWEGSLDQWKGAPE